MGTQQLPTYESPFTRESESPIFTIQNLQLTKEFKNKSQIYFRVKNIWNYTQKSPLIDPKNPFGDNFDTTLAYGPLQTRRFFIGFRKSIN